MNLRTMLTLALALATIVIAIGCAKEQPASKTEAGGTPPPVTQEAGQAVPGQVCDTVAVAEPAEPTSEPQRAVQSAARMPKLVDPVQADGTDPEGIDRGV
jgi:hypothetical protein